MKAKSLLIAALMALASLFALELQAQTSDEDAIKQRIIERLATIDDLKLAGKAGENNAGLLEQRGMLSPAETKLMNDENTDRRALYTLLGKRLGLTMTVVGQGRAEEIRKKSATGVWLQDRNGSWYQKQ